MFSGDGLEVMPLIWQTVSNCVFPQSDPFLFCVSVDVEDEPFQVQQMGRVSLYEQNDINQEPAMTLDCMEGTQLGEVLEKLAESYSPIRSRFCSCFWELY